MTVQTLPDVKGALIAHLRASSEIAALAGMRISGTRQTSWNLPAYAVWVNGPTGGPGDLDGGLEAVRFDLWCFGPDLRTANLLWRTVRAYLLVPDRSRATSFVQASTRVYTVRAESGPIEFVDPDEPTWAVNTGAYILTFSAVPAL